MRKKTCFLNAGRAVVLAAVDMATPSCVVSNHLRLERKSGLWNCGLRDSPGSDNHSLAQRRHGSWVAHYPFFAFIFSGSWQNTRQNYLQRSTIIIMKLNNIHARIVGITDLSVSYSYEYKILLHTFEYYSNRYD